MKRILFVISHLYGGGAERALSNLVTHIPNDWEIDILLNNDKTETYPYRGRLISLDIENERMGSVFFHFRLFIKRMKMLFQLKKNNGYAACVSFLDSSNVANILTGNKYCKVIISARSSLQRQSMLPQYKYVVIPLVRLLYNRADRIVAVSKGVGSELVQSFSLKKDKVVVIENGYDINGLNKLAEEPLTDAEQMCMQNKKVIVTAGRLVDVKGYQHLIRAFAETQKQIRDAMLIIAGEGELEESLKELAKNCKIADSVFFAGFTKNLYRLVSKADAFVMTSLYEGFPNAMAEAVCLGIPCIATDFHAGAREILAPDIADSAVQIEEMTEVEYGILVPLCSGQKYRGKEPLERAEQELVKAMTLLLQDSEKRDYYKHKTSSRAKMLTIEGSVNRWLEIISE